MAFMAAVYSCISIHALREEGDMRACGSPRPGTISIHALREEGDWSGRAFVHVLSISIHALREEGDLAGFPVACGVTHFYPRPP